MRTRFNILAEALPPLDWGPWLSTIATLFAAQMWIRVIVPVPLSLWQPFEILFVGGLATLLIRKFFRATKGPA